MNYFAYMDTFNHKYYKEMWARKYNLETAVILAEMEQQMSALTSSGDNCWEGETWIITSPERFQALYFPYIALEDVENAFYQLVSDGVLIENEFRACVNGCLAYRFDIERMTEIANEDYRDNLKNY